MATVHNHYIRAALWCAKRQGFSEVELMKRIGLEAAQLESVEGRTHGDYMTRLVQVIWSELGDEFMGCTEHPCKSGAFAFMTRHVIQYDSLEAALEQGILFYNLFTNDIQMRLVQHGKRACIEIEFTQPSFDPDHYFQEFWMVIWHRFASWLINQKIPLIDTHFTYSKPYYHTELKYLFPCRHKFNQSVLKISFSKTFLTQSPVRTQHELSLFLKNSPVNLITIPGEELSYQRRIRSLLLHHEGKELKCPSFVLLAEFFNMSPQTLRRKLQQEGSSYSMLKDAVKCDLAIEKLVSQRLSVSEVANMLGYAEPRSFSRAFKGWTGVTPTDYMKLKHKT
ncbi:AraC family transcriptional regulator [Marinomonas flavescens]|uniref:AraC family transcriptional regulator n=1 Tax=Marinomonas flavescens TaxID=2529379 RepID=UPI001056708B|nr:AraC family transcriptional regulator [Marinomonas flavescens]